MKQLLSKFTNGEERYNNDPVFNQCMQMLVKGVNPLSVLDDVLKMREKITRDYEDYIRKNGTHTLFYKPEEINTSESHSHFDRPYICAHTGCNKVTSQPFKERWKLKDDLPSDNLPIGILKLSFYCREHK